MTISGFEISPGGDLEAVKAVVETSVIGYAVPKTNLEIRDNTNTGFKPLVSGKSYPLLSKVPAGYLVLCDAKDGTKRVGLVPSRDWRGGESVDESNDSVVILSVYIQAQLGFLPLSADTAYPVISREGPRLSLLYKHGEFKQTLQVSVDDVDVYSPEDYLRAIDTLLADLLQKATKILAEGGNQDPGEVFRNYHAKFAKNTLTERARLESEFNEKWSRAKGASLEKFEAEQKAKGLVKYGLVWITPDEVARRTEEETKRQIEAERQYKEEQKRLLNIPLPFIVVSDCDVAFPSVGDPKGVFHFRRGNRFVVLPYSRGDYFKYLVILLGKEFYIQRFSELPTFPAKVQLDLAMLAKQESPPVSWDVRCVESARVAGIKRLVVSAVGERNSESEVGTRSICFIVQRDAVSGAEVSFVGITEFVTAGTLAFSGTVTSETISDVAKRRGVFLTDGAGHLTSLAFPPDGVFPNKSEIQLATLSYQQFQSSQDLFLRQIKNLQEQLRNAQEQERDLNHKIDLAVDRARNAANKNNAGVDSRDLGKALVGRSEYEAAMTETRTLQAQRDGLHLTMSDLQRQIRDVQEQVITVD